MAGAVALAALAGAFAVELGFLLVGGRQLHVGEDLAGAWAALTGHWMPGTEELAFAVSALVAVGPRRRAGRHALAAAARPRRPGPLERRPRARGRTGRGWGEDSLAPFLLRQDKAFFFAHGGVLAYRTVRETAVVSSDPVGPPGAAPRILRDFIAHARERRGGRS